MFSFIICLLAYLTLLKLNKRFRDKYISIRNITEEEYNTEMREKLKDYNPYEPLELPLI